MWTSIIYGLPGKLRLAPTTILGREWVVVVLRMILGLNLINTSFGIMLKANPRSGGLMTTAASYFGNGPSVVALPPPVVKTLWSRWMQTSSNAISLSRANVNKKNPRCERFASQPQGEMSGIMQRSQTFATSTITASPSSSSWKSLDPHGDRPTWSAEWKSLGLGATLRDEPSFPPNLFFVQLGFGVDQHGKEDATKAAIRAVRNAIEFNSIPGVISHIPGGRAKMLIHVKLGVPSLACKTDNPQDGKKILPVDALQVAKVFPYGQLLPLEITQGGISFHTGRVVEELGDTNDVGICVVACVSLGYGEEASEGATVATRSTLHKTYSTNDGY